MISFNDLKYFRATTPGREEVIPISAPITGSVLHVLQRSETTLPAGMPIFEIGRNNGVQAQVLKGLSVGDQVILYPSSGLREGVAVEQPQIR